MAVSNSIFNFFSNWILNANDTNKHGVFFIVSIVMLANISKKFAFI
jgi:hypothetical protein